MKSTFVSFIGSGNLAWHIAPALDNTDYGVREVYSLHPGRAKALVDKLYEAEVKLDLNFSDSPSKVFIIASADDAMAAIVEDIQLPSGAILLHTSGSQPLSKLAFASTARTGVFYPLQTFTKARKVNIEEVPIFIESEDREVEKLLLDMGRAISKHVYKISSEERKALHVAAVFASNFSNHMLTIAKEIMTSNNLSFDYLKPLIAETINKGLTLSPDKAQTGPAKRGDLEILDKHMEFLAGADSIAEIYKVVSQHIIDTYSDVT